MYIWICGAHLSCNVIHGAHLYLVPMDSQCALLELEDLFTYTDSSGCERKIRYNAGCCDEPGMTSKKCSRLATVVGLRLSGGFVSVYVSAQEGFE